MTDIPHKVIADPATRYGDGPGATRGFRTQRLTAMVNIVLIGLVVYLVVRLGGAGHATMVEAIREPWIWVPLLVLFINVPMHMRIGIREVIEDYVHEPRLMRLAYMANTYVALVIGLAGAGSVIKIVIWG